MLVGISCALELPLEARMDEEWKVEMQLANLFLSCLSYWVLCLFSLVAFLLIHFFLINSQPIHAIISKYDDSVYHLDVDILESKLGL